MQPRVLCKPLFRVAAADQHLNVARVRGLCHVPVLDSVAGEGFRIAAVDESEGAALQIGEFARLVGLSVPQLRRYDRLRLLQPAWRSPGSGYRYYAASQTGAARVIALLRSMDMPIADVRQVLAGASQDVRRDLLQAHRARLEARLEEVRRLLDVVAAMTEEDDMSSSQTEMSAWLHVLPRVPVSDLDRSIGYYEEALGFRLAWRTTDGGLAALATGDGVELLLLTPWQGSGAPPPQAMYVYVEDPDALCAEYTDAGADIVAPVASRPYGMRDFVVRDPDGHQFTLGRGEETLRDVADHYGLTREEIAVNPTWLDERKPRG